MRSRLGRVSGSIHAIEVTSHRGVVELKGRVLEDEVGAVLHTARSTRGVRQVVDALERRPRETAASALARTPSIARRRRAYWTPATRLAVATSSAAAAVWGLYRGGAAGAALASLGAAGLVRSATNRSIGELTGLGRPSRAIDLKKTITIRAPAEDVFRVLTDFESYPRFMRHVRSVERVDENRWRVTLAGLAGRTIAYDAVLLQTIRNEHFSWTNAEPAPLEIGGSVRLEPLGPNRTRVTIHVSYAPARALLGHEIAAFFHAGAKRELDDDVLRLQSRLEHGRVHGS